MEHFLRFLSAKSDPVNNVNRNVLYNIISVVLFEHTLKTYSWKVWKKCFLTLLTCLDTVGHFPLNILTEH